MKNSKTPKVWIDNTAKKKLANLRKLVAKEKKRLRITEPHFTIQMDARTKKLTLSYSIHIDSGLDLKNKRIIKKKQMKKYLKNVYVDDTDVVLNNIQTYSNEILSEMNNSFKSIGSDSDSIRHWVRVYTESANRKGTIVVANSTLRADKSTLNDMAEWLEKHQPKYLNIWNWTKDGREICLEYFKYSKEVGGKISKWKDSTIASNYRRIRAFFNFISDNVDGFPPMLLNKLPIKRVKIITETFTSMEMNLIKEFLADNKDNPSWEWYVPIFKVLIETGMRVSEVTSMLIRNIDVAEKKCKIVGKGGKERWIYFKSDSIWKIIEKQIYNQDGKIRTDTEYIFWSKYLVNTHPNSGTHFIRERKDKPINPSGIQHKTKLMIRTLKLNENLSTHSTRRYFITEMLKKTNGNIPLIAQLAGHSTWDVVRLYTKDVIDESADVNVGLF